MSYPVMSLNDYEFGQVFAVFTDGHHSAHLTNMRAPECYHDEQTDINLCGAESLWTPLTGYTGQDRYSGAVMHTSEFMGGRLEADILAEPGVYVMVVVEVLPDDENDEPEPAGWAVLRYI